MNWKLLLAAGAIAIIPASAQAQTAADCPRANEVEDVEFCQPSLTPNERVKQAFEMLNFPVNGPFMSAYSDTAPFVCSVVGPDRWCVNPFDAMAKGEGGKQ